jgi:membrane protein
MPDRSLRAGTAWNALALRDCAVEIWDDMSRTRAFVVAAALSFYFLLSLVPLLIVFSSLLAYLPIPNVFDQLLDLMAAVVPPDAMEFVQKVVTSVLTPHGGGLLSFSVLGYFWAASGGFSAMIGALDIAYDVKVSRPWWKDRIQALFLTISTGVLFSISLLLLMAGSILGRMLPVVFPLPESFGHVWPGVRLFLTFLTFLAAVLVMYVFGPNLKITFRSALPGAVLATLGWFLGSAGLTFYLRHFADYDLTYGALGAVIVLMLWFYIIAIAMLLGAEVNAQLARRKVPAQPSGEMRQEIPGAPAA